MSNHAPLRKSRMMIATAMIIFGTIALFVRNIALSSAEIAPYRAVMATLLLGGVLILGFTLYNEIKTEN